MAPAAVVEFVATVSTRREMRTRRDVDVVLSARLSDGREVPVLTDRGFSEGVGGVPEDSPMSNTWGVTEEDLETCAWVVGPDEKFGDHTDKDMADQHWSSVAAMLQQEGVNASAAGLMSVQFRVVWGPQERVWPEGFEWY